MREALLRGGVRRRAARMSAGVTAFSANSRAT